MAISVTSDNFVRAESHRYFGAFFNEGAWGAFRHDRDPAAIDNQTVVRLNRDTLYSSMVVDLDAGPMTVVMPDAGARFVLADRDQRGPLRHRRLRRGPALLHP